MSSAGTAAIVSIGSNLGDRLGHLSAALEILNSVVGVQAVSEVYETDPVGGIAQSAYLNLVASIGTVDANSALVAAHLAEAARGRLRGRRWGPRTLDVDVIAIGPALLDDPRLTVPHPRAHQRAFVLRPWLDVDPDAWLPGRGRVDRLLAELDDQGVERVGPMPIWWRR